MATGYEDWIRYRTIDSSLALSRLQLHMQTLMEQSAGPKTMADGVMYDPSTLLEQLTPGGFLVKELNRLEGVVNRVGMPLFQPTRRVDGGTFAAPNTGASYGG